MQDNAERVAPEIPIYLTPEQIRYVLRLVGPIVSDLDASQHEESVAWQIERALDEVLCNWDEDHPEDEVFWGGLTGVPSSLRDPALAKHFHRPSSRGDSTTALGQKWWCVRAQVSLGLFPTHRKLGKEQLMRDNAESVAMIAELNASLEWACIAEQEARSSGNTTAAAYQGGRRSALREAIHLLQHNDGTAVEDES